MPSPYNYNFQTIRELVEAAFDSQGLSKLAFDRFPTVKGEFTPGMAKSQMIDLLLEWVRRQGEVEILLTEIKARNPYQYGLYQARLYLGVAPPAPPTLSTFEQQRLQDLQEHIAQDATLLRQYEDQLRDEYDPRRLLRIQREIQRQKEALARYRQEHTELQTKAGTTVAASTQTDLDSVLKQIEALSQQLLRSEHALRQDLRATQQAVLQHMEAQHRQTVATLLEKLDVQQLELVGLILDAHDKQQIAQWQADELLQLTQQAVVDLRRLRQGLPDEAQWQTMLTLLGQETTWEQKLKLTVPLIPGILAFESEGITDVIPALKQVWQKLQRSIRGGK